MDGSPGGGGGEDGGSSSNAGRSGSLSRPDASWPAQAVASVRGPARCDAREWTPSYRARTPPRVRGKRSAPPSAAAVRPRRCGACGVPRFRPPPRVPAGVRSGAFRLRSRSPDVRGRSEQVRCVPVAEPEPGRPRPPRAGQASINRSGQETPHLRSAITAGHAHPKRLRSAGITFSAYRSMNRLWSGPGPWNTRCRKPSAT